MVYDIYYRTKGSNEPWCVVFGGDDEVKTVSSFMEAWFGKDPYSMTSQRSIENDHREFYLGASNPEDTSEEGMEVLSWKKILDSGKLGADEGSKIIQVTIM